ncbi:MAG: PIN domain-containing protein [Actinomycetota bacterium]|nr:PIN domain-containing protein [Actinomycetota bacterium]
MAEAESQPLNRFMQSRPEWTSSIVTSIELRRFASRLGRPESVTIAEQILARIDLRPLDAATAAKASDLPPPTLRSLDAIQLASALDLGEALGPFITYDRRLAEAATTAGLRVLAPT